MYRRIICVLAFLCIVFSGCTGGKGGSYEDVSRKLTGLEDYTCDVAMKVTNNRSTLEYKLKHFYKSPDRYRIEVLAPKELYGQVTIYNGKSACIYHPAINQYLVTEDFPGSLEYNSFLGSFVGYLGSSGDIKTGREKQGDKELIVVEFAIPKPNRYMSRSKLWLDPVEAVPLKAEIYGIDGKRNVEIYYSNFVCNPGLKDGDFEIIQNIQ